MSAIKFQSLMSLLVIMGLAFSAHAQTPSGSTVQYDPVHPVPPSAPGSVDVLPGMPPVQNQGGVTYVSGGVGVDERQALRSAASDFNLHLLFAGPAGAYLAKIEVIVTDDRGVKVLDAFSNGPYFMAKLQPGRYRVSVDDGTGRPQVRQVSVPARGAASASFFWSKAPS
ncbi:MAG TPA: hypothetical protein VLX09_25445 [Stellaceae bacterium]|nr:hypothetical protein [Stellaceae bacterium]